MRKALSAVVLAGAIMLTGTAAAQAAPAPKPPAKNPNPACATIQMLTPYAKGTDPVTAALLTFSWPIARSLACMF